MSQLSLVVNAGDIRDVGLIPGLGRSPGGGHGNPLQYSCQQNPTGRGAWRATIHRVVKSDTSSPWTHTERRYHAYLHGLRAQCESERNSSTPPWGVLHACMLTQSCPTLCDPVDYSPPGSSVRGVSQARILEWVAISYSRGSSQPRDQTHISYVTCIYH